tara:strand:+ start:1368 stop:2381 length:1014 start_codon:yes stop_codon:yes gene_type:complete
MNATMSLDKTKHYPVMLDQILSIISPQHGGTFIDCTFGGGGVSKSILSFPNTKVLAFDRDKLVERYADSLIKKFPSRFKFCLSKFSNINSEIDLSTNPRAIIFDLGLSSFQLNDAERGFSFNSKGFLDMQMGFNKYSAYDVVNNLDKKLLSKIIKILGEEKDSKIIANYIVKYRKKKKIKTSEELSSIINSAKKNYNKYKKNPATKTFQAIRIFVNQELTELIIGLILATKLLSKNGILVVVSFHSLEDRIVKNFFKSYSNFNKNPSRYLPANDNRSSLFKTFSKKALIPNEEELESNIRSRSAKLRYAIRNDNSFFYPNEFKKKFENYFNIEGIKL